MNGGVPIPGTPMRLPFRSSTLAIGPVRPGLDAQAARVHPGHDLRVEPLLDRLQEHHDQVVRDVEAAERERVLVGLPLAPDELDLDPLVLEVAVLVGGVDRRLAGETDRADADFLEPGGLRRLPGSSTGSAAAGAEAVMVFDSACEQPATKKGTRDAVARRAVNWIFMRFPVSDEGTGATDFRRMISAIRSVRVTDFESARSYFL
jgi:hypothetical protein